TLFLLRHALSANHVRGRRFELLFDAALQVLRSSARSPRRTILHTFEASERTEQQTKPRRRWTLLAPRKNVRLPVLDETATFHRLKTEDSLNLFCQSGDLVRRNDFRQRQVRRIRMATRSEPDTESIQYICSPSPLGSQSAVGPQSVVQGLAYSQFAPGGW